MPNSETNSKGTTMPTLTHDEYMALGELKLMQLYGPANLAREEKPCAENEEAVRGIEAALDDLRRQATRAAAASTQRQIVADANEKRVSGERRKKLIADMDAEQAAGDKLSAVLDRQIVEAAATFKEVAQRMTKHRAIGAELKGSEISHADQAEMVRVAWLNRAALAGLPVRGGMIDPTCPTVASVVSGALEAHANEIRRLKVES
jgi:hypothetical protein